MDKDDIEKKAAYYLTCMNDGFTLLEKQNFQSWINSSLEHKKAFEKVQKLQNLYSSISSKAKSDISQEVFNEIQKENSFKRYKKFAIAASILFCIFIGSYQTNSYLNFDMTHNYNTNNIVKNISLPDGSNVLLDAKSVASIKYFDDKREVNLQKGKAIFDVSKNPNKPFIINTNKIRIKVLGTSFEVNNQKDTLEVEVIDGLVSIQRYNDKYSQELIKLSKGKKILFDRKTNKYLSSDISVDDIGLWKDGILAFHDAPLKKTIKEFKKYKDLKIFLSNDIEDLSITGSFSIEEFDKFLYAIEQIHSLNSSIKGDRIYIFKKN